MSTSSPATSAGRLHSRQADVHRIDDVDALEPFLVSLSSASDMWAFLTSNGGITAGRRNADHALFPYVTEDQVRDSADITGGVTRITALDGALASRSWQPFGPVKDTGTQRAMLKTDLGEEVHLEETHEELGLTIRATWRVSPRFGLVRMVTLTSSSARRVRVVDGVRNLLPPGVSARTQRELAPLLDAYKVTEIDRATGLAWVRLNAQLTDRAEAAESLAVSTVWHHGLPRPQHALSTAALQRWPESPAEQVKGERAAYLTRAELALEPTVPVSWITVVDTGIDAAQLVDLQIDLGAPEQMAEAVTADLDRARARLRALVGAADGWQRSGRPSADAHHAASTMFNIMRGGVPAQGYAVDREDVRRFVSTRNHDVARRSADFLSRLGTSVDIATLREAVRERDDTDLARLVGEYLPLTFSRRHGDPSRPWNVFDIVLADPDGAPRLAHQGNWRDIFQNWEALAWSFPAYTESMVRTFLNATTIDGYNPYRISRDGVDWEVPEPENPWSNIGYWSDHQIIYLVRLLELLAAQDPAAATRMLNTEQCVHADVPYLLATYDELVRDPQNSVTFDEESHARTMERVATIGSDGRLLHDAAGFLRTCSMREKLLILLTAKLVNFVPDGGIWMNTQRPEWNDANNALVGRGLSVVTVAHLHRYVRVLEDMIPEHGSLELSAPLADALAAIGVALEFTPPESDALGDAERRTVLDTLGAAGTEYRARCRDEREGTTAIDVADLRSLLARVREWLARTVRRARREDGLYDAYNLLTLEPGAARVGRMTQMLEGQVAVITSGVLDRSAVIDLLEHLPRSDLFRKDVRSYHLYPEVSTPTFVERNTVDRAAVDDNPLLAELVRRRDRRIVVIDRAGGAHFAAGLRNADDLRSLFDNLRCDPSLGALVEQAGGGVLELFEEVFEHASYTGRSSSFFAYEGVGSVYWHMVSKLMLAVREELDAVIATDPTDEESIRRLTTAYAQIRAGLGFEKTAQEYGAFPHDPYSHTPAGRGARQPGMTGQVKEDMLARWAELGIGYAAGRLVVDPRRVSDDDWLDEPATLGFVGLDGAEHEISLQAGSLALTIAQVPVVMRRGDGRSRVVVRGSEGELLEEGSDGLSSQMSRSVMLREGRVALIEVFTD